MIDARGLRALPHWLTSRPIAHRGLHGPGAPENTLPAFEAAAAAGYPAELDVHVLPDGEVVVFHDDVLTRATGVPRRLLQEDRDSLRAYRLFGSEFGIPSLREVLRLVRGRVPLLIEIKARQRVPGAERALLECLRGYAGELALQSFNPWTMAWFRKHAAELPRGQLAGPLRDEPLSALQRFASRRLLAAAISRPDFINFDLRALPDAWLSLLARSARLPVLCWTVRSDADRLRAEALGFNYVFDRIRPRAA